MQQCKVQSFSTDLLLMLQWIITYWSAVSVCRWAPHRRLTQRRHYHAAIIRWLRPPLIASYQPRPRWRHRWRHTAVARCRRPPWGHHWRHGRHLMTATLISQVPFQRRHPVIRRDNHRWQPLLQQVAVTLLRRRRQTWSLRFRQMM